MTIPLTVCKDRRFRFTYMAGLGLLALAGCARVAPLRAHLPHRPPPTTRSTAPVPEWALPKVLPRVDVIDVWWKGGGRMELLGYLLEGDPVLTELRKTTRYGSHRPRQQPDLIVMVLKNDGQNLMRSGHDPGVPTFAYVSATGELGTGSDWCVVSPKVRRWFKARKQDFMRREAPATAAARKHRAEASILAEPHGINKIYVGFEEGFLVWPMSAVEEIAYAMDTEPEGEAGWIMLKPTDAGTPTLAFPPSCAGRTVYCRARWKLIDGTHSLWSKTVSAKVLP